MFEIQPQLIGVDPAPDFISNLDVKKSELAVPVVEHDIKKRVLTDTFRLTHYG